MWQIAFPIVKDFVGVTTMLQFLWTLFNSATIVLLLTKGGPGDASITLSYFVYDKAFVSSQVGYSQAAGVFVFILGLIGMVLIRSLIRAKD
jgi:multiple sugar transport system permease protein